MLLRLDQSVQELSAISSQSCQASDCHCRKMLHRLDQICELQWQSEERQIWLPMAGGSCTGWSNLRSIGPIYEVYRYTSKMQLYWLRLMPNSYYFAGRTRHTSLYTDRVFCFPKDLTHLWQHLTCFSHFLQRQTQKHLIQCLTFGQVRYVEFDSA